MFPPIQFVLRENVIDTVEVSEHLKQRNDNKQAAIVKACPFQYQIHQHIAAFKGCFVPFPNIQAAVYIYVFKSINVIKSITGVIYTP